MHDTGNGFCNLEIDPRTIREESMKRSKLMNNLQNFETLSHLLSSAIVRVEIKSAFRGRRRLWDQ